MRLELVDREEIEVGGDAADVTQLVRRHPAIPSYFSLLFAHFLPIFVGGIIFWQEDYHQHSLVVARNLYAQAHDDVHGLRLYISYTYVCSIIVIMIWTKSLHIGIVVTCALLELPFDHCEWRLARRSQP